MQETQKKVNEGLIENFSSWKSEYRESCHLIDNLLGFKEKEKSLAKILEEGVGTKGKEEIILIDEEALKFKPIEWSPEELLNPQELLKRAEEDKLHTFDPTKEPLIIIFIGHVDSGKSTLSGQILC